MGIRLAPRAAAWAVILAAGCTRPATTTAPATDAAGAPLAASASPAPPTATASGSTSAAAPRVEEPPPGLTDLMRVRWLAARDMKRATMARADQPVKWAPEEPVGAHPDRFAGLTLRKSTLRELGPGERATLAGLLRDPRGFEDEVRRRCVMGHIFAFRLFPNEEADRDAATAPVTDLVLDLDCRSLWVVTARPGDPTGPRQVHAGYMDPSLPAFRALVDGIVPSR